MNCDEQYRLAARLRPAPRSPDAMYSRSNDGADSPPMLRTGQRISREHAHAPRSVHAELTRGLTYKFSRAYNGGAYRTTPVCGMSRRDRVAR